MCTTARGWDPKSFFGLETGTCGNRGTEEASRWEVQEGTRPGVWGL